MQDFFQTALEAVWKISSSAVPVGTVEDSSAIYGWEQVADRELSPVGTAEIFIQPSLRDSNCFIAPFSQRFIAGLLSIVPCGTFQTAS